MMKKVILVSSIGLACLFSTYAVADNFFESIFGSPSLYSNTASDGFNFKAIMANAPTLNP